MEVTITKRLILILAVLLCVCLSAWAEEAGQETDPGIIFWEDASSASDENAPSASEAGQEIPSPSEEEPAASGEDTDEDEAETPPDAEHTAQHQTREVLQSESDCISIGSPDAHYVKRVYDLYCDDCQRVITANCRTEEVNEPHAFEIQSRTAATCTAAGEITYHCVQCGDFVTETEPMTEHDWSPWDEASGTRTCAVCGKEESRNDSSATEEPAAEPTENPPQDDFPLPQHTDAHETRELLHDQPIYQSLGSPDGHKVIRQYDLVCLDCNQVIQEAYRTEETVEAHPFQVVSGTASTCTQAGQEAVHCPLCGDDYVLDRPLKEHEWGEWETVEPATEEKAGKAKRNCSRCRAWETKVIPPGVHRHDVGTEVHAKKAGCTESGIEAHYVCSDCGAWFLSAEDAAQDKQVDENALRIPGLGHKAGQPDRENERPASCSSPGGCRLVYRCKRCGRILDVKYETYPVDPDAHEWGEWTVTKAAGEKAAGEEMRTCQLCGKTETRAVPANGTDPEDRQKADAAAGSGSGKRAGVDTGDSSMIALWGGLLAAAAAGLAITVILRRKNGK